MSIKVLIFLLSLCIITSHPDVGVRRREGLVCTPPKSYNNSEGKDFIYPYPVSWHVHVTYMLTNKDQTERAIAFREKAREHFKDFTGPDCLHGWDEGKLCFIMDHDLHTSIGPFPIGEWSMWIPNSHLNLLIGWFMQNRGDFSVLFHPNTGCENEDHTLWTIWIGEKWNLDLHFFTPNTQTNEFDNVAGDKQNPTCVEEMGNCGHTEFSGPGLPCCESLTCDCNMPGMKGCYCNSIFSKKYKVLKYLRGDE
jgi:aromatic ring-cleaving dioxygenase